MDAATALDSLSNLLTSLSESPYSLALHAQHIQLASQPLPEFSGQLDSAVRLLLTFYAATDQVWLPFLQERIKNLGILDESESVDEPALVDLQVTSVEAVSELFQLFNKAEDDYLSIPVLQKKIELLTRLHSSHVASTSSSAFNPLLAEDSVRAIIADAVTKGSTHITKGHVLWDLQIAWEIQCLKATKPDSPAWEVRKEHIKYLHMERLSQIHSTHDQTLQSLSSFISEFYSTSEYESHMIQASQTHGGPAKAWDKKERYELPLENSPESYLPYISSEHRVKSQNGDLLTTLYERSIADYAARRWDAYSNKSNTQEIDVLEKQLRNLWCDYIDYIRTSDEERELHVIRRAVRSVPGSGEVWARYIRAVERNEDAMDVESLPVENVADVFGKALSTSLIQKHVDEVLPSVLAKAGYEKRHMTGEQGFVTLVTTLEEGIAMVRNAAKEGDPRMTLEKYLSNVYLSLETPLTDKALSLWQSTAKYYKTSYLAWNKYSDLLIVQNEYTKVRALFKDVSTKPIDWPEAMWQAWSDFEHLHGSLENVENCLEKIKVLASRLERKRAQESAEAVAAQQAWMASLAINAPQEAETSARDPGVDNMVIDSPAVSHQPDKKRKADDTNGPDLSKRVRIDEKPVLKRDRENSTVFVAGLVAGTVEDELVSLFKDCGKVREIRLTELRSSLVATVEFFDRTSVPAALTKDKKRVKGEEIAVHLAWQSTLYVTNFPEKTDDQSIRELFGEYGEIFDVRWPSKKYRNTRRFCYVQFTSPVASNAALALHGRELDPGRKMSVYVSNPEHKQERTDAAANAREIYVAGLSKSVTEADLRKLLEKFGSIDSVRMILDDKGNSKGFSFVEFANEASANAALAANNQELKKRRIAVTLADNRVQTRQREGTSSGKQARRSRTLRVKNLPPGTQEGLLQQALEKHASVYRVEIFQSKNEAIVELVSVAEVGKLLLAPEPIKFGDHILELIEEDLPASSRELAKSGPMFVPRGAAGRPRAGIGSKKSNRAKKGGTSANVETSTPATSTEKGQDDFRRMLNPGT